MRGTIKDGLLTAQGIEPTSFSTHWIRDQHRKGCFMEMNGVFRDPYGVYWRLELLTYRYKLG